MVTRVTVSILDEEGNCLEQGEAELQQGVRWVYNTVISGCVLVEAWDLAGNVTRQEYTPDSRFYSVGESPLRTGKLTA